MSEVFDATPCILGEGPLWHPGRGQLYWVDVLGRRLYTREEDATRHWAFDEDISAAGWVDRDTLLLASETALNRVDLRTGASEEICPLAADRPGIRSNDGRADPWGGFWISTMGKLGEAGAGAIWRYYRGELRCMHAPITVPNAISFAPDGGYACFTDTPTGQVMRQRLAAADGWPLGEPEVFLDLRAQGLDPDGAVIDAAGNFWCAQWGAARVAAYGPDGAFLRAVGFPARRTSCPAFGGPGLSTLFCTSAIRGNPEMEPAPEPEAGQTFAVPDVATGQAEHRVEL